MKFSQLLIAVSAVALLAACGSGPSIQSFTADKPSVPYGGSVHLAWTVTDADSVSLNGAAVTGTTATVTPTATTAYVLTAKNGHGSTTRSVTVTVTAGISVAGGTYNNGTLGSTYLVRMRDASGNPQAADTNVKVTSPSGKVTTLTCTAGEPVALFVDAAAKPESGTYTATASLDGQTTLSTTFAIVSGSTLPSPQVTANVNGGSTAIDASWNAVTGAQIYVAQAFDMDSGNPVSDPVNTAQTSASLLLTQTLSSSGNYAVAVSAFAVNPLDNNVPAVLPTPNASRAIGYLQNLPGAHWVEYTPADYSGGQLVINVPNLDPTEHLAIIPYNLSTTVDVDPFNPSPNVNITVTGVSPMVAPAGFVQTSGSGTSASSSSTFGSSAMVAVGNGSTLDPGGRLLRHAEALRGHEAIRAQETKLVEQLLKDRAAGLAVKPAASTQKLLTTPRPSTAAATNTSFCVQQPSTGNFVRKSATLEYTGAHALFYVDDQDLGEYSSTDWSQLGPTWDNTIYPDDTSTFGAESDVDGNGTLIIFFTHELGALNQQTGSIILGYYSARDVISSIDANYPVDTTTDCTAQPNSGSNGADMFYMNDLNDLKGAGYQPSEVISNEYPGTLGHEFQHLINFNQKFLVRSAPAPEDTWINEGLSVTAEDLIGFGWNKSSGLASGNAYLTDQALTSSNPYRRYNETAFFNWEGDPVGDYEGAHTFFRYFADRMGTGVLGKIVQSPNVGTTNLASAIGEPFDRAFGEWTTALMFSNEVFSPASRFDFTGSNWTPLHLALQASSSCSSAFPYPNRPGYVEYETITGGSANATLRTGGWNAFVTNAGTSTPVTITVTPTVGGLTPYVAVVRYSGTLPDGRQAPCM